MNLRQSERSEPENGVACWLIPWCLLVALMFVYAGDVPPMVNEAHYLVKDGKIPFSERSSRIECDLKYYVS